MAKRSKEWSEKISKAIAQKWKDKEYRQKQEQAHHSEEYISDRSREMKDKWQTDAFKEKMTGETHPNWNPNREEVQRNYGPGWYSQKDIQRNSLREEQGDRDGLTGEKFKTQDTVVRHHIDHNKLNNNLDNLCALTPETHALVHNESLMTKDEYINTFQEGKENLKQNIPPDHWDEKNKKGYKNDIKQENNPISENHREEKKEEQREDNIDGGDKKESDSSSENTNDDDKGEISENSKQKGDKDDNQSEEEGKDITDEKNEEFVEEDGEEEDGKTKEESINEQQDGKDGGSSEDQVPEPIEPSTDAPTEESEGQQENQTENSSDNFSSEPLEKPPYGVDLRPFDRAEQEKEKEKEHWDENRDNKSGSLKLTSGAEYNKFGNKISPDYEGIDQSQSEKGEDFKGFEVNGDNTGKDYEEIGEIIAEKGADYNGIDSTQEKRDKDYANIDEGYGEGGYKGG